MSDFQEIVFSPINSAGGIELPSKRPSGINGWKSLNETQSPYTSAHGAADTPHVSTRNESPHLKGGDSTVYGASFNFVNSIVGAGIIGTPSNNAFLPVLISLRETYAYCLAQRSHKPFNSAACFWAYSCSSSSPTS
jgi:hypothetical protein